MPALRHETCAALTSPWSVDAVVDVVLVEALGDVVLELLQLFLLRALVDVIEPLLELLLIEPLRTGPRLEIPPEFIQ